MYQLQRTRQLAPGLFQGGTDCGSGRIVQSPATIEAVTARMQLALGMFLAMPAAASQQGPQVDHPENQYRRVGLDDDADDCAIVVQASPNDERRAT